MLNYKDTENNIHAFDENGNEEFRNKKIAELGLIAITDEEETAIREQKDIDNQVVEKRELAKLETFLNQSNYIAINYGALRSEEKKLLFLADVSDTFEMTNEEIFDKRDEAIDRINELKEIIKK